MSYVDALYDKNRDRIHVVERVNGERLYKEFPANYTFYYDDPKGKFRTIYGTPVSRVSPKTGKDFHKEIRALSGKRLWESDFKPVFRCLEDNYLGADSPKLQTAFFDIEVDFDKVRGYSKPEDPFNPVTAVAVYLDWMDTLICFAVPPKTLTFEEAEEQVKDFPNTFLFDREEDMLEAFLDCIEDADVLSGWNSEGFDIPYMVNRIARVLSKDDLRRFCLWNQFPKSRMFERYGKESQTYDLVGRVHLDYLELYRKYTYHEMHSYSLDTIAEYELGERKVEYEGTLDQLYNNDFKLFIDYNRQDTALLGKLDKKLRFLDLANELAHDNTVLLQTTMGAVAVTEQAIVNEAHGRGLIVPNKKGKDEHETAAAGAYVAQPKKGMHDWVGSIDINSLYPSAIRALNMGPETIVAQLRPVMTSAYIDEKMADTTVNGKKKRGMSRTDAWEGLFGSLEYEAVMKREIGTDIIVDWEETGESVTMSAAEVYDMVFNSNMKWTISANGTIFKYDTKGIVPGLLERWYAERKSLQGNKKKWAELKNGIELPDRFKS